MPMSFDVGIEFASDSTWGFYFPLTHAAMTPSEAARAWRDNSTAKACQSGKVGAAITSPILIAQSRVKKKVNVRVLNEKLKVRNRGSERAQMEKLEWPSKVPLGWIWPGRAGFTRILSIR